MAEPNSPAATRAALDVQDDDTLLANERFERALFDSARADEVPRQARARVALALGVALPLGSGLPSRAQEPSGAERPGGAEQASAAAEMMRVPSGGRVAGVGSRGVAAADGAGAVVGAGAVDGAGAVASGGKLAFAGKCALVALAGGLAGLLALGHSNGAAVHQSAAPAHAAPLDGRQPAASTLPAGAPAHQAAAPELAAPPDERQPAASAPTTIADPEAATTPEPSDVRSARTAPRPRQRAHRAPKAPGESRLLAEVARLDQARAALAASDAPRVLQHVERYRAEFPNGVLAREAARLEARGRALESGSAAPGRDIEQAR
jgi:hypothetical protein